MAGTFVTKYATYVIPDDWASFTVANLGADDASYASVSGESFDGILSARALNFGFAIPASAVILSIRVEGEWYESNAAANAWLYLDLGAQGWTMQSPRSGVPSQDWYDQSSPKAVSYTTTSGLPSVAVINESGGSGLIVTAGALFGSAWVYTVYLDYIRVIVEYAMPAVVTTAATTDITQTTASSGGNVTDDGDGTCTARGVCWNTTGSPTIADPHTTDSSGTGAFTSALTGLYPSFRYYVRAWATTEYGTVYGSEVYFDTLASASRSLVVRPFTTRAAGGENIARQADALVDWWYEESQLRAELRPTDPAVIPRARWYVVGTSTPNAVASVQTAGENTPEVVHVVYKAYGATGVRDGTLRHVYYPAATSSIIARVATKNLADRYMSDAEAAQFAANTWLRESSNAVQAVVTAREGLRTVDGHWVPAPLLLRGGWIDITTRRRNYGPVYITGVQYDPSSHTATIQTGGLQEADIESPGRSGLPTELTIYRVETAADSTTTDTGGGGGGGGGYDEPVTPTPVIGSAGLDPRIVNPPKPYIYRP